jgi:hypothetical protein
MGRKANVGLYSVMRRLLALLLVAGLASYSHAECQYFRTGFKLLKCTLEKPPTEKLPGVTPPPSDDAPLQLDEDEGPMARIDCSCDYSLSGSSPICDLDRTEDETSLIPTQDINATCHQKNALCDPICRKNVSE